MDIVRLVEAKTLLVGEKILEVLEGGIDYLSFEAQLKRELDQLGCDLLKIVLEALDQKLCDSKERKRDWVVVRKNDQKEILTHFGLLVYTRTYFRNKRSKQYSYLVDEKAGIAPHSRVSVNLKAELSELCTGVSYEGATLQVSRHNAELKVSRQTVASCVKEFQVKQEPPPKQKRRVKELYLEADEDHVNIRYRNNAQARLIYVHEGVVEHPRRHLKNVRYFTTVKKTPEDFWLEVCDYIEAYYDLESLETIFLSGDGAPWIRAGLEYIPGVNFILDRFHLSEYILSATAHMPKLRRLIYQGIEVLNKQAVLDNLHEALRRAEGPARQKRIRNTIKYIKNNWDGIEASVKYPHICCSAEGHVSHVLAARLSSRPMAWSLKGANNMSAMRAVRANGESISEHYLASRMPTSPIVELREEVKKELKRLKQSYLFGTENLNNVPLFCGGNSLNRRALKEINEHAVI